jgi:AraC-like DNA-binding protein
MGNLFFFSGSVTAFFIILLLSKKNKATYDWLLAGWLVIILFHIIVSFLSIYNPHTFLLEISSAAVFLNGPVMWLYTKNLFHKKKAFSRYTFLHFLPFLIHLAIVLPYIYESSLAPLSDVVRGILAWAKLASIFLYSLMAASEIKRSLSIAENSLSNTEAFHVKWLQLAIYAVVFIWVIGFASQFAFQTGFFNLDPDQEDIAIHVAVSIFVIVLGYYGFKQAPVFVDELTLSPGQGDERKEVNINDPLQERYKKSAINSEDVKKYAYQLDELMQKEKLFTDPELTLNKLASCLSISTNQLSQVINQHYKRNFYEFVNTYRVEEVIRILHSDAMESTTMLGIGLDAGFNSKASFNRYFKKHTGKTPSAYFNAISHSKGEN